MKITDIEKAVLNSLGEEQISTLKMITDWVIKAGHKVSKQTVWFALQRLAARGLIEKIERGVYKKLQ
jgi:Fe2+ or Zn2+ uptake regulation protein